MPRGVKNTETNPSNKSEPKMVPEPAKPVEQKKPREMWLTKCRDCASRKWEEIGSVGEKTLFQCRFCKRVTIQKEIPQTEDPLEVI